MTGLEDFIDCLLQPFGRGNAWSGFRNVDAGRERIAQRLLEVAASIEGRERRLECEGMPLGDECREALANASAPACLGNGHEAILRVGRKNPEGAPAGLQWTKVAFIERQNVSATIAIGKNHDGRVRESNPQVVEDLNDFSGLFEIFQSKLSEFEDAFCDLSEKTQF